MFEIDRQHKGQTISQIVQDYSSDLNSFQDIIIIYIGVLW